MFSSLYSPLLPSSTSVSPNVTPTHSGRRRAVSRFRLGLVVSGLLVLALVLRNAGNLLPLDPAIEAWTLQGCPVKILELTSTMEATYKVRGSLESAAVRRAKACALLAMSRPLQTFSNVLGSQRELPRRRRAAAMRAADGRHGGPRLHRPRFPVRQLLRVGR